MAEAPAQVVAATPAETEGSQEQRLDAEVEATSQVLKSCSQALEDCGGPTQYLAAALADGYSAVEFVNWLWDTFPELDNVYYSHKGLDPVQEGDEGTATGSIVHVAALGFDEACSVKPPCGSDLCGKLQAQYVVEGFVTSSQPLLVTHTPDQPFPPSGLQAPWGCATVECIAPFSLGYVKGYARSASLLMLLHRIMQLGLQGELSELFRASVRQIHVHKAACASKVDEALANMKLSARGSLRQANNTIQTVLMLQKLFQVGGLTDASVFIKRWNTMSSRAFQISGRRATALKLLFDVCPKVGQLAGTLVHHVFL